ncbi:hypothetical protein GH714_031380 [Hevea brasiliensis]|uniref:RRM domain-containing protein n=1 Tax=Hevea brasiliensis TaxID=3981 RepID=A0A6A6N9H4_HEVBR|nr:hypothetical protein GH714_031380 [Hevea brasiliensis]
MAQKSSFSTVTEVFEILGSSEHRGLGFVQFAIREDANRAIELKMVHPLEVRKLLLNKLRVVLPKSSVRQRRLKVDLIH